MMQMLIDLLMKLMVTKRCSTYRRMKHVLSEKNDKDGKIIGVYPTKAFLMKDLGTKNKRAFEKSNIRKAGGYVHRGVLLVQI